ncbi:cAMP-binding domain of CRP or a regulatory subunit of cAMP-dependent protein kinases [Actinomadura meyerae]|uniref:cAMP-binding domain of CRP or a regulatory subunit of cAMP-dependent protein kinases n=1 Tax=Actinomadura meyerae TaxID=240840 RepID=A0A239K7B7_9ACTN|nr:cyclic nucleotide-binding domain-containing protein [Actinomadura meyerae]SNT14005.1 cAMP-binding domain of CRP or a regulatory subunit of cAMP-dependent protein kinases [Actinomadura meyerae]
MEQGFWHALDEAERHALRAAARPRQFAERAPLVYQGDQSDHVIIIERGWAKVTSSTEDGHEVVLAVRGPGDLLAESAVLGGRTRSATVTALSPVRALVVPAGRFTGFLDEHPQVWKLVSGTFVQRIEDADRRLQEHVIRRAPQRLAGLLAHLAERSAQHVPPAPDGSIAIGPPLSQGELGSWMDASRETVARSLNSLRRAGLIRTGWRTITVVDLPGLRAMAAGQPTSEPRAQYESSQPLPPPHQLSNAEWRVAKLAAEGLTNRQIAVRLSITMSTVEQHLTRVYRKLNLTSRAEISSALPSLEPGEASP